MTQQPARHCIFCGRQGSSKEDIFPLWVTRVLAENGPFSVRNSHGRNKQNLGTFGLFTREVCPRCNNGWMSTLESSANPLLSPILTGTSAKWDLDEQRVVATWAFKTALMI